MQRHSGVRTPLHSTLGAHGSACASAPDQLRVSVDAKNAVPLSVVGAQSGNNAALPGDLGGGPGAVGGNTPDHDAVCSVCHTSFCGEQPGSPTSSTTPGTSDCVDVPHNGACHCLEGTAWLCRCPGKWGAAAAGPPAVASTRRVTTPADAARARMSRGTFVAMVWL